MKRLFFILGFIACCSCKKVVTLKLDSASPYLVIEGEVTDQPGPYTVKISNTVSFYKDNVFPPISGAVVRISDGEGNTDSLLETSAGIYSTQTLQGVPGHTYTLTAAIDDTIYTATSTMPIPVAFDSLTFNHTNAFGTNVISATPNFQDPAGVKNYYQFVEFINGVQLTKDIFVFDDRLSDGKYISINLRNDSTYLKVGDSVEVRMYGVDQNIYNYFYEIDQSSGTNAFNTTATPANPVSNFNNRALGYFSAHTLTSRKAKVAY